MFADVSRISKEAYEYDHVDPSSYTCTKSLYCNTSSHERLYGNNITGSIRTNLDSTSNNISYSGFVWFRKEPLYLGGVKNYYVPLYLGTSSSFAANLHYSLFNIKHSYSRGFIISVPTRDSSLQVVNNSTTFYLYNELSFSNEFKVFTDWICLGFSAYKPSASSTQLSIDVWEGNRYIGTMSINTHSSYKYLGADVSLYLRPHASSGVGSSRYSMAQSVFYYSTNGAAITQDDADAHFNNGVPTDWSNISMSSGHNIFTNHIYGDHANDLYSGGNVHFEDTSGNGFHITDKSSQVDTYDFSIREEAP